MEILVPIFVCVVLPVSIVAIYYGASINSEDKREKVLIKAIESNSGIDADKLVQALTKPRKTAREILNLRLLKGCIFTFIGLGLTITGLLSWIDGSQFKEDPVTVPMLLGSASLAVGLSYLIVYFVTRKQINNSSRS